eukprot:5266447-Alexandrium_andersonii.AAC.1
MACPGPRPAGMRPVAVGPGAPGFCDAPRRAAGLPSRNSGAPPNCAHTSNMHPAPRAEEGEWPPRSLLNPLLPGVSRGAVISDAQRRA